MSGVGKSIIGKELAKRLNYDFLDTDKIIEKKENKPLIEILKECKDDQEFLEKEKNVIINLNLNNKSIISPGGSVVYEPKAIRFLKANSFIIFLDLPLEELKKIMSNPYKRGIIGLLEKGVDGLFKERLPLYKKYADMTINIQKNHNKEEIIKMIINKISQGL